MTIIQLEYLLAVANCGSFSLAAEHCFVTQPSLSMQVKALEEELGVVLLDRSKKPVIPTEAGDVVLERARETLRAYNNIRESVAELKGETSGKLRLGVIPTIAPYLLHKFIPAFVRDYPKVELEISEMITSDIVEALKRDRIDAALVASGTCGEGILEQELFNDRFFAYVSPENALYERSNIRIEDIDLRDLVILSAGNCMRDQIIELCQAKRDMPSHYSFESGSLDTLMRIVDCTSCLTIIPEMAVDFLSVRMRRILQILHGLFQNRVRRNEPRHNFRLFGRQVLEYRVQRIAGYEGLATGGRHFDRYMRNIDYTVVVRMQIIVVDCRNRNTFVFPKFMKCRIGTVVFLYISDVRIQIGDYLFLILFEFHNLKSFDVARDFLENDIFRRHDLFRQRAYVGINNILLGTLRHDMQRVNAERRQSVALVVEIVARGVVSV